ncbi:MAG: hypothetical protein ACTSX9_00485 [Candidatus Njordarchaeales archaeon]
MLTETKMKKRLNFLSGILETYEKLFPEIYAEGVQAARRKSVKKYIFFPSRKILWLVVGRSFEYIVTSYQKETDQEYMFLCSCPDYLFHVLLKARQESLIRRRYCYHIIARVYSEREELKKTLGLEYDKNALPDVIHVEDSYFKDLLKELLELEEESTTKEN